MITTLRPTETHEQAIGRLAEKARQTGVSVFEYPHTGEWYSPSRSEQNRLHRVTLVSCDCQGFQKWQRCSHHSALLDHLGHLPTDPQPSGPAIAARSTLPVFDAIERVLCRPENADLAYGLEIALSQPDTACDELPNHQELIWASGLDCTPDEVRAWFQWQNERQEVIDRHEMALAA